MRILLKKAFLCVGRVLLPSSIYWSRSSIWKRVYHAVALMLNKKMRLVILKMVRYYGAFLSSLIFHIGKKREPPINKNRSKRTVKIIGGHACLNYANLKRQFNTKKGWGNIEFTEDRYADYYLALNNWRPPFYYNPERTLLYFLEPIKKTRKRWRHFNEQELFYISRLSEQRMATIWYLSKSYHWLKTNSAKKTKVLSTVTSDNDVTFLHRQRLSFIQVLDKEVSIDVYGRRRYSSSVLMTLSRYRGDLPFMQKDDGMFPYKYHFASENTIMDGYVSEKLTDAILAECLCFYVGTETAKNWIDSRAFIHIDITKPDEALEVIIDTIENNEWEKRIEIIRREKQKILDELQVCADIERIISNKESELCSTGTGFERS